MKQSTCGAPASAIRLTGSARGVKQAGMRRSEPQTTGVGAVVEKKSFTREKVIAIPGRRYGIECAKASRIELAKSQGRAKMRTVMRRAGLSAAAAIIVGAGFVNIGEAQQAEIERGKSLVAIAGCTDCHTPGYFFGKPDMARYLGGSEVGFEIPGLGVFHGPNLTPDSETGLGKWSIAQIVSALQGGKRPDGRGLVPIMPWRAVSILSKDGGTPNAAFPT